MKKIYSIGFMFLFLLGVTSCAEDFIETEPENSIGGIENQLTDLNSAQDALIGMYNDLQDNDIYDGTMVYFAGMWTDEMRHTGSFPTFAQMSGNDPNTENVTLNNMWNGVYNTIFAANNLVDNLVDIEGGSQEDIDVLRGQAYGVRALMYFNLVRFFGPVPLELVPRADVTELDAASSLPRASESEVYTQILNDLGQAIALLEGKQDVRANRWSTGASYALRAQVHLQMDNLTAAQADLETLLGFGYALESDYSTLFGNPLQGSTLSPNETIFGIEFSSVDGGNLAFFYSDQQFGGRDELRPRNELINAFEAGDARVSGFRLNSSGQINVGKYTQAGNGDDDIHVIRYADVLLMLAEVYAKQGNATASDYLNEVRERAGLAPVTLDAGNVDTLIPQERFVEFFAETGDRYHTLKRFGQLDAVVQAKGGAFVAERDNLWPIPQNEIDNNTALSAADQNAGY
ncbi:RagB/SusD family nutrient uptake outer membrane protein [Robertkochia flava]|uniref:RagB/SusD family nutrient uptake outer membrane protein n=1 Tax=Robertkochia flava TaxID=3447986 RepID=UPI001CCEE1BB|nr:RagB/SusD family nutrient uptake outer membrane protein [Robertkochia marina]